MDKKTVDWEIHDELRRDRDRLIRENIQLKYANQLLESTLANERKAMPFVIKREAEKRARDLIFIGVKERGTA